MMKFFRKHMKYLLVIGTVLLMIAFVIGPALTDWLAPPPIDLKAVRGEVFGREVTLGDMQPAFTQATILSRTIPVWDMPWYHLLSGIGMGGDFQTLQMLTYEIRPEPLTEDEWYMLLQASRRHNTYVTPRQIEQNKEAFGLTPVKIASLRDNLKVSTAQIEHAIAAYVRVLDDANQVLSAVVASEADVRDLIRQTQEKIDLDVLIIASANFLDEAYEPTDEEIQQHYDEYKNEPAPRASTGVLFGYQLPEEVKIEYIRIDPDALQERLVVADDEAFTYWEAHQDEFFKPRPEPAEGEEPAPRENYETFTAARNDVIARLKTAKARREAVSVARNLIVRLSTPWGNQPTGPDGYREIPAPQRSADLYPDLIESLRNEYPDALTFVRKDFLTSQELNSDTELSRAFAGSTQNRVPLARAAFLVPGTSIIRGTSPMQDRLFRNIYETAPEPFVGGSGEYEGNVYVLRTVAVKPPEAPPLDEVRDRVIDDVRKKRAYDLAGEHARSLVDRLDKELRLREGFLADETLREKLPSTAFMEPDPFPLQMLYGGGQMMPRLMPNYIRELGYDPALIDEVTKLVETHKAEDSHPATVYAQENQARWLAFQVDNILPVTTEAYENNRQQAIFYVQLNMMIDSLSRWFDPEQIRARVRWQDAEVQDENETDAVAGEGEPTATGEEST